PSASASTRKPVPPASKQPPRDTVASRATTPIPQPPPKPATPAAARDPLSKLSESASTPRNKAWDAFSAIGAAEDTNQKEPSGLEAGLAAWDATEDFLQKLVGSRPTPSEETPEPEPTTEAPTPPSEETPAPEPVVSEPTLETPTPEAAQRGGESSPPGVALLSQEKPADSPPESPQAAQTPIGSAQPTPTAESINSFGAKSDIGSRISSIATSTDSGRAVSSISIAKLRQPE
ncbi:MAG: hypothetical protein Q6M04_14120, partial [Thermostichus sp. BF3_bins_97]